MSLFELYFCRSTLFVIGADLAVVACAGAGSSPTNVTKYMGVVL